jgi:hypothetical protein
MSVIDANSKFYKPKPCDACRRLIKRGEHYFMVNKPDGTQVPVHVVCIEKGSKPA